ncbi:MAG: phosphocarrier protein HPr [Clostridium sp. SCN 57-10]|nr:MAG: phosphocarrier protein HPr [Clostridium sp. SCN 57-10]
MYSKEITVTNQVGLYARPATFFIQKANEFRSTMMVEKDDRKVNAKSLLGVLSLGITKGSSIMISAEGPDEEEAVNALCTLIANNFGE